MVFVLDVLIHPIECMEGLVVGCSDVIKKTMAVDEV